MTSIEVRAFPATRELQAEQLRPVEEQSAIRPRILFWLGVVLRAFFMPLPPRTGDPEQDPRIAEFYFLSLRGID